MAGKSRRLVLWIVFLTVGSPCLAQTARVARNAVFVELLGNGGVYSLNVERMLNDHVGVRLGYATWSSPLLFEGTPPDHYSAVPVTVSYLFGGGERKLEVGGGILIGRGTFDRNDSDRRDFSFRSVTGILGYRSQPPGRGYLFRAGLTPFYSSEEGDEAYPQHGFTFSAGVSFGYRF